WTCRAEGETEGGWGRQVLGETWVNHHGHHNFESTRGVIADGREDCPIVRGCDDIWGPSDVYGLTTLCGDCSPVIVGHVLVGMDPADEVLTEKEILPVAWTKTYTGETGNTAQVFTTTMGHSGDLKSAGFRRLCVNACYWALGMAEQITADGCVDLVGEYEPNEIGVGGHKTGLKPADYALD
ncbi:MAG TPA: hypothetical protein QGH10_04920, partial [Armatimonadota bacterium]|nr:hypothetical protein [Armatimonadota bacterium]